ncbi:hypothetical protein M23134_00825 [Microscilla marina ATCC 23134]|uniref:Uncharacterized protein n=1 Tax=Microscilla marina ATCC 23134 TaxID=313606 RepID=A1ZVY9_MICM2|nr:hypothetical protein M23134_00825 [Microscilla marina ATCC 23134]
MITYILAKHQEVIKGQVTMTTPNSTTTRRKQNSPKKFMIDTRRAWA